MSIRSEKPEKVALPTKFLTGRDWYCRPPSKDCGWASYETILGDDGKKIHIFPAAEHFGVKTRYEIVTTTDKDGKENTVRIPTHVQFPYTNGSKVRELGEENKNEAFKAYGKISFTECFNLSELLSPRDDRVLIITEGEGDVLAGWDYFNNQSNLKTYVTIIGVPAIHPEKVIAKYRDEILKFRDVYLAFDSGPGEKIIAEAGEKGMRGAEATEKVFRMLMSPKVKVIDLYNFCASDDVLELASDENKVDLRSLVLKFIEAGRTKPEDKYKMFYELINTAAPYKSVEFDKAEITLEDFTKRPAGGGVVPSCFKEAFQMIRGIGIGSRVGIVMAPQGTGKTTLTVHMSVALAKAGTKHAAFWLENAATIRGQWLCAWAEVDWKEWLANESLIPEEKVKEGFALFKENVLSVTSEDVVGLLTVERVLDLIIESAVIYDCKVFMFDNITYTVSTGETSNERSTIDNAIALISKKSKELDIEVIIVNQLTMNRQRGKRGKIPYFISVVTEDGRGSQMVANTASWVIALEKEVLPKGGRGRVRAVVLKNRDFGDEGVTPPYTLSTSTGQFEPSSAAVNEEWDLIPDRFKKGNKEETKRGE